MSGIDNQFLPTANEDYSDKFVPEAGSSVYALGQYKTDRKLKKLESSLKEKTS